MKTLDQVFTAFNNAYEKSRQKLKQKDKDRNLKLEKNLEKEAARQVAIAASKRVTKCAACNQTGHWIGDPECPRKDV